VSGAQVPSSSKQEGAYLAIRKGITDGTYAPGSRLVADRIARDLAISPVPVREALRRLEAEGFVEFERHVGARVRTLDAEAWVESLEVIAGLDGYVMRLALPHIVQGDIAASRRANKEMRRAIRQGGPEQLKQANQAVHRPLTDRCPNRQLVELLGSSWTRLYLSVQGSVFLYRPDLARIQVDEHEALLRMIENGASPEAIESAVRDHTLGLVAGLQEHLAKL
jgi:DNA-binding GntR family transcriptional regulator